MPWPRPCADRHQRIQNTFAYPERSGVILQPVWAAVAAAGTIDEDFHSETGCVFLIIYGEEP